jgi:Zn-dependent protease with chaperone function
VTAVVLGTIVALAAGMLCWMMVSIAVTALWHCQHRRLAQLTAGIRAQALAILRLLPAITAVAAVQVILVNFLRFEPTETSEMSGTVLRLLALTGVVSIVVSLLRAVRAWRSTRRVVRGWPARPPLMRGTLPIVAVDAAFPLVAVVGIVKPRLYIARAVLTSCDRHELDAMIAHEAAHVAARDNLTRLLFLCAPMFAGMSRTKRELEGAWTAASEEAADDLARVDTRSSLALASALTKVSRLAVGQQSPLVHVSAILSGSAIERRVRRLLEPPGAEVVAHGRVIMAAALIFGTACVASLTLDRHIYEAAELCIRYLP